MPVAEETSVRCDTGFFGDVAAGLSGSPKTLPCRWLYDDRGSDLFEAITRVADYYPTRTETLILERRAEEIARFAGPSATLVEYGAGAGLKTEILLKALRDPSFYVPIDIAENYLAQTAHRIEKRFRGLAVVALARDFMSDIELPAGIGDGNRVGFFPGSTIGNLDRNESRSFLIRMRKHLGRGGKAIIGADLVKDTAVLLRAYDDGEGVTARFNLNILARINRELGGDFRLDKFRHEARWNAAECAVEMHLVSLHDQTGSIGSARYAFRAGETIHTESSRKYDRQGFAALAAEAGWKIAEFWTDDDSYFGVFGLRNADRA